MPGGDVVDRRIADACHQASLALAQYTHEAAASGQPPPLNKTNCYDPSILRRLQALQEFFRLFSELLRAVRFGLRTDTLQMLFQ